MKNYKLGSDTAIKLVLAIVGLLVGILMGLWAITWYIARTPVEALETSWCGLSSADACEVLADNSYWINGNKLDVGDNYGYQVTVDSKLIQGGG